MWLTLLNIVFFFSFMLFAYFNLNDEDAWLWVSIYVVAALLCGFAVFDRYFDTLYLLAMSFYLIYAVVLFFVKDGVLDWIITYKRPSIVESMQATKPYIEKTREFFGLLIISAALGLDYLMYC